MFKVKNNVFGDFKSTVERYNKLGTDESAEVKRDLYKEVIRSTEDLVSECVSTVVFTGMRGTRGEGADSLFANLLYRVTKTYGTQVDAAMAVGVVNRGVTLYVNPVVLASLVTDIKHVVAIIKHECYHIVFKHIVYLKEKQWKQAYLQTLYNIATDCQINQLIKGLPDNCVTLEFVNELVGKQLKAHAGSQYYFEELLNSQFGKKAKQNEQEIQDFINAMKNSGEGGQDGNSLGDLMEGLSDEQKEQLMDAIMDHANWKAGETEQEVDVINGVLGELIKDAYERLTDKQRGTLPGSVQEAIADLTKKRAMDWRSMVRRGLGTIPVPYRATKKRLNRRQPERISLSGRMMDRQVEVVIFIDTSGSMSQTDIAYSLGEIHNIIKDIRSNVEVVLLDTKVQEVYHNLRDVQKVKAKGRGGTCFQPAFDYLRQTGKTNQNTLAIYFTDGYGESEQEITRYGFNNLYWVITGDHAREEQLSCDGKGRVALLMEDVKYNKKVKGKS